MGSETSSNVAITGVYTVPVQNPFGIVSRSSPSNLTARRSTLKFPSSPEPSPEPSPETSSTLTLSTVSQSITPKRKSDSMLTVNNGITGKYISSCICMIAQEFWQQHIDKLSVSQQLEIGCSIFFSMLSANAEMKKIMKSSTIGKTSLKYLDMMGWLIRHLMNDHINLHALLTKLGLLHQQFGVNINHFNPMLQAMHETFAYYFESAYNMEIKYAIDEIFSLAAQIMTGQELKYNYYLNNLTQQFQGGAAPFLQNLQTCLKSSIGREYLYRYLSQTWCDEIAIFLKELFRFKKLVSDKERFMAARDIIKTCIKPTATFCLNLSHETRVNALNKMAQLNQTFLLSNQEFRVKIDFFSDVEREIYKLILDNHWNKFVEGIQILQSKSFSVE